MVKEIFGQALGILATVLTCFSCQLNRRTTVLFAQSLATASVCTSYFLLGATSGFVLNIVCLVRRVSYYFAEKNLRLRKIFSLFFCLCDGGSGRAFVGKSVLAIYHRGTLRQHAFLGDCLTAKYSKKRRLYFVHDYRLQRVRLFRWRITQRTSFPR